MFLFRGSIAGPCSTHSTPEQVTQCLIEVRLAKSVSRLAELVGDRFLAGAGKFACALRAEQYSGPQ